MRKASGLFFLIILLLGLVHISPLPTTNAQAVTKDVSFQPSIMDEVMFTYDRVNHWFELAYQSYYMRFRPFAIYNGTVYTQRQIVQFLRNRGASYNEVIFTVRKALHWGFNISGIPQDIQQNLDYLGFKLTDHNFPLSNVEIETFERKEYNVLPFDDPDYLPYTYNVTLFKIPKINLEYSFEDLQRAGYTVSVVNKTYLLIGNVKNKTDLLIDPITYSSPVITVIGGSKSTPLTFFDIWNASVTNNWNVVFQYNNTVVPYTNRSFLFDCKLLFGNGTIKGVTWFNDTDVSIVFTDGIVTGNWQYFMEHLKYSYTTLGENYAGFDAQTDELPFGYRGITYTILEETYNDYFHYVRHEDSFVSIYNGYYRSLYKLNIVVVQHSVLGNGSILANVWNTVFAGDLTYGGTVSIQLTRGYFKRLQSIDNQYSFGWDMPEEQIFEDCFAFTYWTRYFGGFQDFTAPFNNYTFYNLTGVSDSGIGRAWRFQSYYNGNVTFVNCNFVPWRMTRTGGTVNATIYRKYDYVLNVTDSGGVPIENAEVRLYDVNNTLLWELNTNAEGEPNNDYQLMGYWVMDSATQDLSDMIDLNPFRVEVRHADYYLYNMTFNIYNRVNHQVSLTTLYVNVTTTIDVAGTDLTPFIIFLVCGLCIGLALIGLLVPFVGFLSVILSVLILIPIPLSDTAYLLALQVGTLVFCSAMLIISILRRNSQLSEEDYERKPAYQRR